MPCALFYLPGNSDKYMLRLIQTMPGRPFGRPGIRLLQGGKKRV